MGATVLNRYDLLYIKYTYLDQFLGVKENRNLTDHSKNLVMLSKGDRSTSLLYPGIKKKKH